jgi:malate permease and related proteins
MIEFLTLLGKISPLYVIVALGYIGGKKLKIERDSIASALIYFIAPVVVFNGVASAPTDITYLSLPILTFSLACMISIAFFVLSKTYFTGAERNLIGFMSGSGNTGYFGLPVVLALFGTEYQNIAILSTLGLILFENTLGYYYIARHNLSAKEALRKVLRLPAIYAYMTGLIINVVGYNPPLSVAENISYFRGAYVVLGMFIIGLGLAAVTRASFDGKLVGISFSAKFLAYPLIILGIRALNNSYNFYDDSIMDVLLVLSITPIASNTVAFATKLKAHPEKAALTVLLSTLFALVYIPLFVSIFIS